MAFAATKVSVLPLTVMVSLTAKPFASDGDVPSPALSLVVLARAPAVTAPPVRLPVLAAAALRPSAVSTPAEPDTARSEAVPVFRVTMPPVTAEALAGVALPDRVSIAETKLSSVLPIPSV